MTFARPDCPRCHGGGEIETIHTDKGIIVAFVYDKCPCTFRSQWVDQEDWTNERPQLALPR